MRVSEGNEKVRAQGREPNVSGRFPAALRKASAGERRPVTAPQTAGGVAAARPLAACRASGDRALGVLRERHDAFREEERAPAAAGGVLAGAQPRAADGVPEIRALVRALPAAVEASRVREGEPLSLSFGRSLSVDIRGGAAGVEIVLRADAPLARAASAELPALVAALRARGIAVARADVAGRPGAGRRPR